MQPDATYALRTFSTTTTNIVTDHTGLVAAAIDLYFRETAFWQFSRGTRLGNLRRLIRQYGRTQDRVFPTGTFFKNGNPPYGTDVNFPVTSDENPNPKFHGCIDRNA